MITHESEYNGKPVIKLMKDEEDRFPFSFGVMKAKMILSCINEIQAFVDKHDKIDKKAE